MKELFWCWVCWRSAPPRSLILERDTARFMNEPGRLESRPGRKELNANMSEVVLPPSRIFVQPQEYTEALVVFFFIPLCDIKHPWRSRYCQTIVQWQVTGNSSLYWFLRTTMQQLYFSLKEMMQTRNTRMNQCCNDAEDIGCRVWKRTAATMFFWGRRAGCSKHCWTLNWAPDLPRKPSCALLREENDKTSTSSC